jgi:hypothetical protein
VSFRFGCGGTVTVKGLPANVTKIQIKLKGKSSGLVANAKKCAALAYTATLTDTTGHRATAKASDKACKTKKGARK